MKAERGSVAYQGSWVWINWSISWGRVSQASRGVVRRGVEALKARREGETAFLENNWNRDCRSSRREVILCIE
jgi:hypothetical protein